MTTKADYTEDEWKQIATAPTTAGMAVGLSQRGGSFREAFSMAKAYAEARQQQGESELLDALVGSKPQTDKTRAHSSEEAIAHAEQSISVALGLLDRQATPEEIEDYKGFIRGLAQRVAEAHEEHGQDVSPAEQAALDRINAALGG